MRIAALVLAAALTAGSALGFVAPAKAQTLTLSNEAKDNEIVSKALNAKALAAVRAYQPDLLDVLNRAPDRYPLIERQGGRMLIRTSGVQTGLQASLTAALAHEKSGSGDLEIVTDFNTYGTAAFLLGSLAIEARDFPGAIRYLDRGLALQPDNLMLVTEKGAALIFLRRLQDALALYEKAEKIDPVAKAIDPQGEARLLRAKGFVLIELNRLKEAEAAYAASLEIEPDHAGAKGELDYIRKLGKGAQPTAMELKTGDKAKYGDAGPPKP